MYLRRFLPLVLLLVAVGCAGGDDGPTLYNVTGQATYSDGSPVTQGTIVYVTPDGTSSSYGVLDQNGHYTLMTGERKGAPAGMYTVYFTITSPAPDYTPTQEEIDEAAASELAITPGAKQPLVAERYQSAATSGLSQEIPAQNTELPPVQVER